MINQTTCKGLCDVPCECSGRLALDPHDIAFAGGILPDKIVLEDDDVDFLAGVSCNTQEPEECSSCQ